LVLTGFSIIGFLKPKYEPMKTRGVLTPNQRASNAINVPNGIAAELELIQRIRLSIKNKMNTTLKDKKG
jgi:hypothetical protein